MANKILKNNEIMDSIRRCMKERTTSPIYGVFIISWLIFHWEFIYTVFFVSEQKIWEATNELLKNEYLISKFFDLSSIEFYILQFLPFVLTWLIIWVFPKWISIPAFRKELECNMEKRKIKIMEEKKLEKESLKILKVTTKKAEEKKRIEKVDPSINWENEYNQFKKTKMYRKFKYITESIYTYNGLMIGDYGNFQLPKDILIYAHTNNLIVLDKAKEKIELTEKGKFFVKQFSLKNNPL